jgi:peptide-methionine (S)-S-oxide reductase
MKTETAVFGGGCFWCTEAVFKMLKGVISVMPGYAGGRIENPTYESVSEGNTGHAEVIEVKFDPQAVSFETLLTVFFGSHDPSTKNRQGADVGTQYRSVILYTSEAQKAAALKMINEINSSNSKGDPVVTEVAPLTKFYGAEEYHIDYFTKNRNAGYCQLVINPKLEKVQEKFYKLLA